ANVYGGAKGNPHSSGVTNVPNLSGIQLPFGLSMPDLSNLPNNTTPSSPAGSNTPGGTSNGAGGAAGGLGGLLGGLPLGLPL
ncbi:MAG TPA: hypothetical protein VGM01_11825, partial [Ktedonobacteraceae bacterium]